MPPRPTIFTPERRQLAGLLAVLGTFVATGWWGILLFGLAWHELGRYNSRLYTRPIDPSTWRTPRNRWKARSGIWPEMPVDDR